MSGTILVIGASGHVGRPLVRALVAGGQSVVAASRSGTAIEGARGVVFDFADAASVAAAFEGVDRVFLLAPTGTMDIVGTLLPVVELAASRNAKVVFMSAMGADADDSIPYRQIERAIERTVSSYVILRPNWFADNFHVFWKAGIDHGVIAVPAGEGKSSFIDVRDIASAAAAALTTNRFDGKAYTLTGPEALGYADAARILSTHLQKPVTYQPVDDDAFVGILTGAGVPEAYARFLASIFVPVREGWTAVVTGDVETLTGEKPRGLEAYVRDNRALLSS